MNNENKVQISGRLVRKAEWRKVNSKGKPVSLATFDIACNYVRGVKTKNAMYFRTIAWAETADRIAAIEQGTPIFITDGYLMHDVYTTKEGHKRNQVKIVAVDFVIEENQRPDETQMKNDLAEEEEIPW